MDAPTRIKPALARNTFLLRLLFALFGLVASTDVHASSVTVLVSTGFYNTPATPSQSGTFTATFDASPSLSPSNAVIALSMGTQTAYAGLACIARFNTSGDIDAYNGTTGVAAYQAASVIPYSANLTYHFRMVVNVPANTYSVYVTPPGSSELLVGSNYGFRNAVASLDTWTIDVNATPGGSVTVSNLSTQQAAAPTFSPVAGTYTSAQAVTITSATSGASIAYTTDGSTPTESGGTVTHGTALSSGGSVTIGVTTTLTAIAFKTGYTDSATTSGNYTINIPQAAAPTFSPVAGTYTSAQTVTITSATSGASIRYTTDGSTPSETAGTLYSSPVTLSVTTTLKAVAYKSGMTDSAVFSATYTIGPPSPVISSAGTAFGTIGAPFSYQITASNSPTSYGATGLPASLSVNPSTGLISGTPGVPGSYTVTLSATNNAGGTGTKTLALQIFIDWALVGAVDFNGDGKPDLIWQNTVTGERAIWLMNGTTPVSSVSIATIPTEWNLVGAADFNGDGKPDLLWQDTVTGQCAVWLMNGTTPVSSVSIATISTDWDLVGAADFNKNGNSDLILQNAVTGERTIWLMNGTTHASTVSLGFVITDWDIVGAADFNGDGYPDLVWQNKVTGQRSVWLMNGTTYVSGVGLGSVSTDWNLVGAADLNGDGKPDLIWQDMLSRQYQFWLMNGTTTTSTLTFTLVPSQTAAPSFSPSAGAYTSAQTVTITSTTGGASIRYTTDGSMPSSTTGTLYSGLLTLGSTTTLKAIAFKTGYTDSTVTSATYTINIPTSIPGLRLWLEADAGVMVTSGQVTTWQDQSIPGGHDATAASGSGPALVPNGPNGKPVLSFSGSNSMTVANFMVGAAAGEMFIVLKASTVSPPRNSVAVEFSGSLGLAYPNVNGDLFDDFGVNGGYIGLGLPPQDITAYHVYNASTATNNWVARLDGLPIYKNTNNQVYFVGNGSIGTSFYGDIAEVIVYNRTLSDTERTMVITYLAGKYGLYSAPFTPPTSLVATALSSSQVSLTWSDTLFSTDTIYTIERKLATGGSYQMLTQVHDTLSYIDSSLASATGYTYHITSSTGAGNAPGYSNEATATTLLSGTGDEPMPTDMLLWLKADAGVDTGQGHITHWGDQSGHGNDAQQNGYVTGSPNRVIDTISPTGKPMPVISFNGSSNMTVPNFMVGAVAGEMFIVLKASTVSPPSNSVAVEFSGSLGLAYPNVNGYLFDDFGVNGGYIGLGLPPQDITAYHVYNASTATNNWVARLDGLPIYKNTNNQVYFVGNGSIGTNFYGDIAEVIVYNQVLTLAQRVTVEKYIITKYNLPVLASLTAPVIGPASQVPAGGQANLSWSPVTNAAYYSIERRIVNGAFAQIAQVEVNSLSFADTSIPAANIVSYRVQAVNYAGSSPYSNIIYALVSPNAIDPTDGLTYEVDVLLGLDPAADNSKFLVPYPTPPPPAFSPAAGNYTSAISVSISDPDSAAAIYYTTDGTTPTTSSAKYGAPIPVTAATTINAMAVDNGLASAVASASYTFGTLPPAPIFTLLAPSGATLTTP